MDIANLARDHEVGDPIPHVDYTPEERQTWATVLQELTRLYPTHGEALLAPSLLNESAATEQCSAGTHRRQCHDWG